LRLRGFGLRIWQNEESALFSGKTFNHRNWEGQKGTHGNNEEECEKRKSIERKSAFQDSLGQKGFKLERIK
jgi:hypothetical protein